MCVFDNSLTECINVLLFCVLCAEIPDSEDMPLASSDLLSKHSLFSVHFQTSV